MGFHFIKVPLFEQNAMSGLQLCEPKSSFTSVSFSLCHFERAYAYTRDDTKTMITGIVGRTWAEETPLVPESEPPPEQSPEARNTHESDAQGAALLSQVAVRHYAVATFCH